MRPAKGALLHTTQVKPGAVRLAWSPAAHAKRYAVQRDRRRIGLTTKLSFTDRKMRAGRKHRYRVRAIGTGNARGPWSRELHVSVPKQPAAGGGIPSKLARVHVDRLFWRAGFGPTEAERSAWVGKKPSELVDFLLTQPQSYRSTSTPPVTQTNGPIDPLV